MVFQSCLARLTTGDKQDKRQNRDAKARRIAEEATAPAKLAGRRLTAKGLRGDTEPNKGQQIHGENRVIYEGSETKTFTDLFRIAREKTQKTHIPFYFAFETTANNPRFREQIVFNPRGQKPLEIPNCQGGVCLLNRMLASEFKGPRPLSSQSQAKIPKFHPSIGQNMTQTPPENCLFMIRILQKPVGALRLEVFRTIFIEPSQKVLDAFADKRTMGVCGPVGYTTVLVIETDLANLRNMQNVAVFWPL